MNSLFETLPQLVAYQPALIGVAVLCLMILVQNFLTAPLAFLSEEQVPGMPLKGDHSLKSFRVLRTYSNSVESMPAFGFALLIAIIAGVNPTFINWCVGIYIVSRVAFWVFYYSGFGKVAGGPRTISYVLGLLVNIAIAGSAIYYLI